MYTLTHNFYDKKKRRTTSVLGRLNDNYTTKLYGQVEYCTYPLQLQETDKIIETLDNIDIKLFVLAALKER